MKETTSSIEIIGKGSFFIIILFIYRSMSCYFSENNVLGSYLIFL